MAQTQNAGAAVAAGHFSGLPLAGIQVDFGADVSAKLAVGGAVDVFLKAVGNEGLTPVAVGTVDATGGAGQGLKVLFEGTHGTDTYDGTNSETLAAHLEDVIIALGTVDGVNVGELGRQINGADYGTLPVNAETAIELLFFATTFSYGTITSPSALSSDYGTIA